MTRKHLWLLFGWDEKWDRLYSMKKRLTETLQSVNDAAESINTGDDAYQREERAIEMRRLKTEKFQLQRSVKNADEDLKIALDTVDSKDDEATSDDREQVELATEALDSATVRLAEVELSLANAIEVYFLSSSIFIRDACVTLYSRSSTNSYLPTQADRLCCNFALFIISTLAYSSYAKST